MTADGAQLAFRTVLTRPTSPTRRHRPDGTQVPSLVAGHAATAAKRLLRQIFHAVGLEVTRRRREDDRGDVVTPIGVSALQDIHRFLASGPSPIVFDVGANVGQSVKRFSELLPGSVLHSFEPSPTTFRQLEANTRELESVRLVNSGVGSVTGTKVLIENDHSDMSSVLRPGKASWGSVVRETEVAIMTLDDYCQVADVKRIDLLKIDTQGYELEVLQGAAGLMAADQIRLVYMEVTFSDMYEGLPTFDVLYRFLLENGFRLVALYNLHMEPTLVASWCDALFVLERSADELQLGSTLI